jgi:sulfur carrier protein
MSETAEKIHFQLNGEPHIFVLGANLHDLMCSLELENQALALAVNRQVIPRQRWVDYVLQADDQVDIVRAIGGG